MCEKCEETIKAAIERLEERTRLAETESEEFKSIEAASIVAEALEYRLRMSEQALNVAAERIISLQSMIEGRA